MLLGVGGGSWELTKMTMTFSQAVEATVESVREQMLRVPSGLHRNYASPALLRRHAAMHVGSAEPTLVGPVIEAVRDRLAEYAECLGHPAGPGDPMGETVYCDGSCR